MIQTCVLRLFHKSASPIKKKKGGKWLCEALCNAFNKKRKHNSAIAYYEEKSRDRRIKYTSLLLNAAWENQTIIVVNWSFTLLDYWKFIVCERRELFCFWSRRELFHSKLTRKMLMFLLVFLGNTSWFQMFVIERCLWVFTAFSPKRFLLSLSLISILQWPSWEIALQCFTHCINHHFETLNDRFACILHFLHYYFLGKPETGDQILQIRR